MKIKDNDDVMDYTGTEHLPFLFKDLEYIEHTGSYYSDVSITGKDLKTNKYYIAKYNWGTCEMCDDTYDFTGNDWEEYVEDSIMEYTEEEYIALQIRLNRE